MAGKLTGNAIQSGTIELTQLSTTVATNIVQGGGPKITSITYANGALAASNSGNESIVFTGTGFEPNVQIFINGNAAPTVSRTNTNSVSFTTPALNTGTTYPIYVVNPDGGTAIFIPGMRVSSGPVWSTASSLPPWSASAALSRNLTATSDSSVTYSLADGSSLPAGLSLAANGVLSGTLTSPPNQETTYNFNVVATDAENQKTTSAFSITATLAGFQISPSLDGKTSWAPNDGAFSITEANGNFTITPTSTFTANVKLWGEGAGYVSTFSSLNGGAGGAVTAVMTFESGQPYYLSFFGGANSGGDTHATKGGNAAGIFYGSTTSHANSIIIAGGGGGTGKPDQGGDNNYGNITAMSGGAGGHPAGSVGPSSTRSGGGGTQIAGGSGGSISPAPGSNGLSGSALNGGAGIASEYNARSGGGGGGYYGGGSGSVGYYISNQQGWGFGGGGGGGSNFATSNASRVTSVTQYSGSAATAGNNSDSDRGGAGTGGSSSTTKGPGRIYIEIAT
jgi:hypothetical protein